jgi:hypothetical protein
MSRREIVLTVALFAIVGALYLAQPVIGPLFATAAIILIAGEALIAVVDDGAPELRPRQD